MKKWTMVGLFWFVQVFTDIMRVSLAVALLTLCMGCMRLITASANSAPIDLAPRSLAASLTSIRNTIGTFNSMGVAIITGYIVGTTGSFVPAPLLAATFALGGALSYVFLMKSFEPLRIRSTDLSSAPSTPSNV